MHVEFCCKLYEYQLKRGAHFVHEHPWGARSWDMECVTKLIHNEDVMIAMVDQCRFGLETSGEDGSTGPARKRTGFMSSSWTVIEELDGACNGLHKRHNHLIDGRAKGAEVYPLSYAERYAEESPGRRPSTKRELTAVHQ